MIFLIKKNFKRFTDGGLLVKANSIISAMTGNANFPTPNPSLAIVQGITTDYSTALDNASTGDRTAKAIKDAKRAELINILGNLADYVTHTATDRAKYVSSNFDLVKDREPSARVQKPEPPVLSAGNNPGEISAAAKSYKNARSNVHLITEWPVTETSIWVPFVSTSAKYTYTGLKSETRYAIKHGVVGVKEQYVESDIVTYVTQ